MGRMCDRDVTVVGTGRWGSRAGADSENMLEESLAIARESGLQDPHRVTDNGTHFTEPRGGSWERPGDQGDDRSKGNLPSPFLRLGLRPQ